MQFESAETSYPKPQQQNIFQLQKDTCSTVIPDCTDRMTASQPFLNFSRLRSLFRVAASLFCCSWNLPRCFSRKLELSNYCCDTTVILKHLVCSLANGFFVNLLLMLFFIARSLSFHRWGHIWMSSDSSRNKINVL